MGQATLPDFIHAHAARTKVCECSSGVQLSETSSITSKRRRCDVPLQDALNEIPGGPLRALLVELFSTVDPGLVYGLDSSEGDGR